jgi:hypothetical protein
MSAAAAVPMRAIGLFITSPKLAEKIGLHCQRFRREKAALDPEPHT